MKKWCLGFLLLFLSTPGIASYELQPFKAKFALYYKWIHLGYGEYQFKKLPNGNYTFEFTSKMRVLLFSDKRQVSSTFTLDDQRLMPLDYQHHRQGTGHDYVERVQFLPDQKLIRADFRGNQREVDYDQEIIDGLLVQFQLMLDVQRRRSPLTYRIFESFGVMDREFVYIGDDLAELDGGDEPCTKVEVVREQKDFKTQICFAQSLNFLPVLLEHYSKGKKQFVARLVEYSAI